MTVVVLGASPNPERISNMAVKMLIERGYAVIPVHPARATVCGIVSVRSMTEIEPKVDTLTVYVNASISKTLTADILRLQPRRAIFNPGAENAELQDELQASGIEVVNACTLVMLKTGQF
jgi:uncharacterized protein